MDLKKYEELREKIDKKDFEGSNKALDRWMYLFSFVGNIGSVFFSYFLVFPGLYKAVSINVVDGFAATILSLVFTIVFLVIFEIIKRYFIGSFSNGYISNAKKVKARIVTWFIASIMIIGLSFYLSIIGSKNLASTRASVDMVVEANISATIDSLVAEYEKKKMVYLNDNEDLRKVNSNLRTALSKTPINYLSVRTGYQETIDKNVMLIEANQARIDKIDSELAERIADLKEKLREKKSVNERGDTQNIILFIVIAIFCEVIIFVGVYFREWYEYNLFIVYQQKFEKIHLKKNRYRSLLMFIYGDGKLTTGDRVISGSELKKLVAEKTNIPNPNKLVDEFLSDMDRLGIFNTVGKRRYIVSNYTDALNTVDNFDDALRVLEDMK